MNHRVLTTAQVIGEFAKQLCEAGVSPEIANELVVKFGLNLISDTGVFLTPVVKV